LTVNLKKWKKLKKTSMIWWQLSSPSLHHINPKNLRWDQVNQWKRKVGVQGVREVGVVRGEEEAQAVRKIDGRAEVVRKADGVEAGHGTGGDVDVVDREKNVETVLEVGHLNQAEKGPSVTALVHLVPRRQDGTVISTENLHQNRCDGTSHTWATNFFRRHQK
jgi:hypothetical protein